MLNINWKEFASRIAKNHPDATVVCSHFTASDLLLQVPDETLFRDDTFSSFLCEAYGRQLMRNQLKKLATHLTGKLDKRNLKELTPEFVVEYFSFLRSSILLIKLR